MKKALIISLFILFLAPIKAEAIQWGNIFKISDTKTETSASLQNTAKLAETLINIQNEARDVDSSVQNTFLSIAYKLLNQNDRIKFQDDLTAVMFEPGKTDAEKSNAVLNLMSKYISNLTNNKTETISTIQNLSTSEKLELLDNVITMVKDGKKYANLAKETADIAKKISDTKTKIDNAATTIASANNTIAELKSKAETVSNIVNELKSLTKASNI